MRKEAKTEQIKTRIPKTLKRRLDRVIKCKESTESQVLREAVVSYVEREDPIAV